VMSLCVFGLSGEVGAACVVELGCTLHCGRFPVVVLLRYMRSPGLAEVVWQVVVPPSRAFKGMLVGLCSYSGSGNDFG